MSQVYLSQFARRAGVADTASYAMNATPAPLDTYIQYNRNDRFGAEVHFRYIYPIHSFQHGNNTNALGFYSHTEGASTFTGFTNTYSSSILSSSVTLSATYGNITSSFRVGDYLYINDSEFDNIYGTVVTTINDISWDDTSSYLSLDTPDIHITKSYIGTFNSYYIQNLLGNQIARAYIAHAEGKDTYAAGIGSHAEGSGSYAIGHYSHTEGNNTVALGDYQTIVGQYNIFSTSQSAFIIGDGYAEILTSGTFGNSPASGSSSFYINSTYSPYTSLTGSIITVISASSSVSETFIIEAISNLGGGEYEVTVNRNTTQNYYEDIDTYSITKVTRHNLLFASQSWFQVSASNVYLQGIPGSSSVKVLMYDNITGQVTYTASSAFGGPGSTANGPDTSIQFNNGGDFDGVSNFTFDYNNNIVTLTGSMLVDGAISASFGSNTVGFYGTSSWAVSSSFITASNVWGPFGSNSVLSASYASSSTSASYAATASFSFTSSYASSSPNFANTNLIFTDNRRHDTNRYSYFIYSDLVGGNETDPFQGFGVSGSFHYFNSSSNVLGTAAGSTNTYTYIEITSQSIDLSFNADPIVPSVYSFTNQQANFSSSLNVTNSVYFPGLTSVSYPNVVVIDTASGKLYYTSSFGGGTANVAISSSGTGLTATVASINFTGAGVATTNAGNNVTVNIPGGAGVAGGANTQIQFNSGSSFSGSGNFSFNYVNNIVYLTGSSLTSGSITLTGSMFVSGAISSSLGPNTVGFFGTASWAQSASFITASNVWGPFGSSSVLSASYASSSTFASTASFITASNIWGPLGANSVLFASGSTSASYALNSTNAASSSFITASNVWGPFGSSSVLSASYASGSTSASYAVSASVSAYALGINLSIQDENITVKNSPTFINFTGSNVLAAANGTGVDVFVDVSAAETASFTNLTTWNFTHNLKHKYVVIQALDTDHKQIIPESIQLIDTSSAILTFPTPESGYAIATIGGALNEVVNIFSSTSSIVGNGADKSFNIVHNFGTRDLHVTIYENSGNYETVYADILRPDVNTIRVNFAGATPPSSQQFVVYISR